MTIIEWQAKVSQLIREYFESLGISYESRTILLDLKAYLNFKSKLVDNTPREIFKSKVLLTRQLPQQEAQALEAIERKISAGQDITGHLSRLVLDPLHNDLLFNDWRIQHIHISNTKRRDDQPYYDRSDYLLFVAFSKSQAFFIDIREHKEDLKFESKEFLAIMLENWPPIMEPFILKDQDPLFVSDYSDADIKILRKKGYSFSSLRIKDKVIRNPGIGRMTTGTNILVAKTANSVYRYLYESNEAINENEEEIRKDLSEKLGQEIAKLTLVIKMEDRFPYFRYYQEGTEYSMEKKYP